jgi:hypothetical protein
MELSKETLISALDAASSQHDASRRGAGEAQLLKWEATAGFHALLQVGISESFTRNIS